MTTFGYARVSTRSQDVTRQVKQLVDHGVDEIRQETSSGAGRRPVLDALLEEFEPGDVLVVTALDRLGRVGLSLIEMVDGLAKRDVGVRALHGGIDTTDPVAGRIILYVMAALAEAERTLIVERTRHGLAAAKAAGRNGGRPTVMSADRLAVARRLVNDEGLSIAAAARTIGVSRPTLSRHLMG